MPRPASTPSSRTGSAPRCARRGSGRSSRIFFSLPADQEQVTADASASVSLGRLGFAHRRRDAGRSGGAHRAHLANRSGSPRTPPRLAEKEPAGCARDPARQTVATGLHAERHVTRTAVGERDPRRQGGIASRVGGLCLADLCARLAHRGQRGDDGRCGR